MIFWGRDSLPLPAFSGETPLRILGARTSTLKVQAGRVGRSRHSLVLGTARGSIEVVGVKPDGRNEMDVAAWLRGAALAEDASWGSVA